MKFSKESSLPGEFLTFALFVPVSLCDIIYDAGSNRFEPNAVCKMFSSEPILKLRADSNRPINARFQIKPTVRVEWCGNFSSSTPRSNPQLTQNVRFVERFRATSRGATHQRTISPHRSPPREHHVLGVVRHRHPVVSLREEATEAIHDPS